MVPAQAAKKMMLTWPGMIGCKQRVSSQLIGKKWQRKSLEEKMSWTILSPKIGESRLNVCMERVPRQLLSMRMSRYGDPQD